MHALSPSLQLTRMIYMYFVTLPLGLRLCTITSNQFTLCLSLQGLLPIKWMAIEAIIERLFTEKSDV